MSIRLSSSASESTMTLVDVWGSRRVNSSNQKESQHKNSLLFPKVAPSFHPVSFWEFSYQSLQQFAKDLAVTDKKVAYFICSEATQKGFLGTWRNSLCPYQNSLYQPSPTTVLQFLAVYTLSSHLTNFLHKADSES